MNKSFIPNSLTFINLSLGIISIILCFQGKTFIAGALILAAALIDRYDGKVARKYNVSSSLGKELDSLSDLVSFGVAPSILAWKMSLCSIGFTGFIILLIFPICGAFRLARFNITDFKNIYTGIPITVSGSLLTIDSMLIPRTGAHIGFTAILMLLLSYLMVSSIRVKKL